MTDPVDVVRQVAPPAEVPSELLERVRNDLMATITERPTRCTGTTGSSGANPTRAR
jgi:hypothetical protein